MASAWKFSAGTPAEVLVFTLESGRGDTIERLSGNRYYRYSPLTVPPQLIDFLPAELSLLVATLLVGLSFVASAISAAFGLGGGVSMLIVLLMFTPPAIALPVHAVIQVGSNMGRAWLMRSEVMLNIFKWMVPGVFVGVLLAGLVFTAIPTATLQVVLALFILWSVWTPKLRARPVRDVSYIWVGGIASFTAMFLGATGPFLAAFLTPERYGRFRTVATHATCMTLQHLVRMIAFAYLGFQFTEWVPFLLAMIASGFAGTWLGAEMLKKVPESTFRWVFKLTLSMLALRLLYKALI